MESQQSNALCQSFRCAVIGAAYILGLAAMPRGVSAAKPAFDSAASLEYDNGWLSNSNGGYGFNGGWSQVTQPYAFIGSSTVNGAGDLDNDSDINTPRTATGRAWGMNAGPPFVDNSGTLQTPGAIAHRFFNGNLSNVGESFSIDVDTGTLITTVLNGKKFYGQQSWKLDNSMIGDSFTFLARADLPDYLFQGQDTGVPRTSEGVHCVFTMLAHLPGDPTGPRGWEFQITPISPGGVTHSVFGLLQSDPLPFSTPDEFFLDDFGSGGTPANACFFNNISVDGAGPIPEPSSALVLLGGAGMTLRRRRSA